MKPGPGQKPLFDDLYTSRGPSRITSPEPRRRLWSGRLSPDDLDHAVAVAEVMARRAWEQRFVDKHTWNRTYKECLEHMIAASASESVFAKLTDLPWFGEDIDNFDGPDVGPFYLRSTTYENGHLLVHAIGPNGEVPERKLDKPGPYVLAIAKRPGAIWRFVGWTELPGCLAVAKWNLMDTYAPCWWVPQNALYPMSRAEPMLPRRPPA